MKISKKNYNKKQQTLALMEHLEKVYMLMDLLEDIASFSQLKDNDVVN